MKVDEKLLDLASTPSDINQHLYNIKFYASECESIVELGVRACVSTYALLAGHPQHMLSVDIAHPDDCGGNLQEVEEAAKEIGTDFLFKQESSLEIQLPDHDLLFIDTIHTEEQLGKELRLHAGKTKKYILMHDTGHKDLKEMRDCILKFLTEHPEWDLFEHVSFNSGLTILKRV